MDAVAWWAVSAPKVQGARWPWLCQKGPAARKHAGRVKVVVRRRDKRRGV
jgi:hypothetical protein